MALNSAINTGSLGAGFIYSDGVGGLTANAGVLVTKYTANNTWSKNSKTQFITVISWNGGAGGGSGRQGSTTAAGGGSGGAPCGNSVWTFLASAFNSSETVTIGGGGAGGLTQGSAANNGNVGTIGSPTTIGNIRSGIVASGFGLGGTTTTAAGGVQTPSYILGSTNAVQTNGPAGGDGGNTTGTNGTVVTFGASANPIYSNGSGGGGSGADTGTARQAGNGGGIIMASNISSNVISAGGAGGIETGTINGTDGNVSISTTGGRYIGGTGGGGGGGQKSGGSAGIGGAGGIVGGGGGGGGGSIDGTTSGAGGAGARGELWVIEYFG